MKNKGGRESNVKINTQLPRVESYLVDTFRPVTPREDFVNGLKSRLADPTYVHNMGISNLHFLMLIIIALITIMFLVAGMVKLMVELFGAMRIIRMFGKQTSHKKAFSPAE